jgi:hypothetical protein
LIWPSLHLTLVPDHAELTPSILIQEVNMTYPIDCKGSKQLIREKWIDVRLTSEAENRTDPGRCTQDWKRFSQ